MANRPGGDEGGGGDETETETETGDRPATRAPTCPHCESPMYKRHCKYVCPQHGVVIDCSDPFR